MKNNRIFFGLALLLLSGCQSQLSMGLVPAGLQRMVFAESEILIPADLNIFSTRNENHRIADNDSNDNDLERANEYRIEGFTLIGSSCSPSSPSPPSFYAGPREATALESANGDASWWRFTDTEMTSANVEPDQLCKPPAPTGKCVNRKPFEYCDDGRRVYALCSEKDGKTVVICISQMKDDPELAKQIFETFKWTE